ncbi:protein GLUTAMINE DUMPER 5-like [Miscanthus floridulus]|uniref:protein GLUTAMINE DUMPER 5-like n=1 Tax=Miscanthus floridulus TaxID=154761 RepID=UPI003457CD11
MRLARIAMAMGEDCGGASSSSVQPAAAAAMAYGRVEPPPFWSTPTPYLFIGFAVVMALIAVALAVLLCSRRKEEEEGRRGAEPGVMSVVRVLAPLDREDAMPKVLVVMAGHSAPSFLASAAPFATSFTTDAADGVAKPPQHGSCGGKDGKDAATAAV